MKESRDQPSLGAPSPSTIQAESFSEPEAEAQEEEQQLRHHHDGLHEPQQVVRHAVEQRRQHVPAGLLPPQRRR